MNAISMSKGIRRALVATAIVSGFAGATAQGVVSTVILNDTNAGDNFLYNNSPATNFANSGLFYYDARGAGLDRARPVIRFDLASLPSGATITDVRLELKLQQYTYINTNAGNASVTHNFAMHQMLADWSETTSNWNDRSAGNAWSAGGMAAGADYKATAEDSVAVNSSLQGTYLSWNITSLYNSWMSGAAQNYGVNIMGPAGDPSMIGANGDTTDGVFRLYNSEYADDTFRPHLVITYAVPAPASIGALGMGGLMLARRRRATR